MTAFVVARDVPNWPAPGGLVPFEPISPDFETEAEALAYLAEIEHDAPDAYIAKRYTYAAKVIYDTGEDEAAGITYGVRRTVGEFDDLGDASNAARLACEDDPEAVGFTAHAIELA